MDGFRLKSIGFFSPCSKLVWQAGRVLANTVLACASLAVGCASLAVGCASLAEFVNTIVINLEKLVGLLSQVEIYCCSSFCV